MSYTPPDWNAISFEFSQDSYAAPAWNAIAFDFGGPQTLTATRYDSSSTFYAPTVAQPGTRYAFPDSDLSSGAWTPSTGTDLYAVLDEASYNDADYIVTSSPSTCLLRLSDVVDPGTSNNQVLRYRAQSSTGATLIARLKQGTTTIASATHSNVPSSWTEYMMVLTGPQCDAITDYNDLRVELEAA